MRAATLMAKRLVDLAVAQGLLLKEPRSTKNELQHGVALDWLRRLEKLVSAEVDVASTRDFVSTIVLPLTRSKKCRCASAEAVGQRWPCHAHGPGHHGAACSLPCSGRCVWSSLGLQRPGLRACMVYALHSRTIAWLHQRCLRTQSEGTDHEDHL